MTPESVRTQGNLKSNLRVMEAMKMEETLLKKWRPASKRAGYSDCGYRRAV